MTVLTLFALIGMLDDSTFNCYTDTRFHRLSRDGMSGVVIFHNTSADTGKTFTDVKTRKNS